MKFEIRRRIGTDVIQNPSDDCDNIYKNVKVA